jgi:hypothetical protein
MINIFAPSPKPEPWKTECHALFGACWNGDTADINAAWYRAYWHMRSWCPKDDPHRRQKIVYCFCKFILGRKQELSHTKAVTPDGRVIEVREVKR